MWLPKTPGKFGKRALASRACFVKEGTLRLARQVTGGMGSCEMSSEKLKRLKIVEYLHVIIMQKEFPELCIVIAILNCNLL